MRISLRDSLLRVPLGIGEAIEGALLSEHLQHFGSKHLPTVGHPTTNDIEGEIQGVDKPDSPRPRA